MNITRFTDYSLRTLIYLSLHEDTSQVVTIKEVADQYGISKNHLMKVVQDLNVKKYINATRGKNGGIRLNRPPQEINIGELVRTVEHESTLVECFGDNNQCVITPSCQLKNMFAEAMESFFSCLDKYTLADLIRGEHKAALRKILIKNLGSEIP